MKSLQILMMGKGESYEPDQLVFEIEVQANATYDIANLLKPNGSGRITYDFTIDYGDGSSTEIKTGSDITTTTINHTYTTGIYTLILTGSVPALSVAYGWLANIDLLRVLNWGDIQEMTLYDLTTLTSIPQVALPDLYNDYFDFNLFKNTSITNIPSNLFNNQTNPASTFYELPDTFLNTPITSIPTGFFDFVTPTIPMDFKSTFKGCTAIINTVDAIWSDVDAICSTGDCFEGAINIANYASIPNNWKGL